MADVASPLRNRKAGIALDNRVTTRLESARVDGRDTQVRDHCPEQALVHGGVGLIDCRDAPNLIALRGDVLLEPLKVVRLVVREQNRLRPPRSAAHEMLQS